MALEDLIEQKASQAASVSGDAGSVTQRSLDELIRADRYLAQNEATSAAMATGGFGLRFSKWRPPGTASGACG